jgi:formylglycine-generating enzyme required for sulfatase activity
MAGNVSEWCLDAYKQSLFGKPSALVLYSPLTQTALVADSDDSKPAPDRTHKNLGALTRLLDSADRRKESREATATEQSPIAVTYRGGSYRDNRLNCQSPVRRSALATQQDSAIGFRPVLLLKTAQ